MRVTTKGQVTIPKDIRDYLGIAPGSEVDFVREGKTVQLVPTDRTDDADRRSEEIRQWARRVAGTIDLNGMTSDEYFEWIRGPRDDLDPR